MKFDKSKIKTQDQEDEPAAIDQIEDRVEAELNLIESKAKEAVAHGLQDEGLEREARQLKERAKRRLKEADNKGSGS